MDNNLIKPMSAREFCSYRKKGLLLAPYKHAHAAFAYVYVKPALIALLFIYLPTLEQHPSTG